MVQIKDETQYKATLARIEELLPLTWGDQVPDESPEKIELALLSDLVADYEDEHVNLGTPSLIDTIRLRMYEMGLTQQKVASMLGISAPRMSAIMNGKAEPSLALARTMCQKLNIEPSVALGL